MRSTCEPRTSAAGRRTSIGSSPLDNVDHGRKISHMDRHVGRTAAWCTQKGQGIDINFRWPNGVRESAGFKFQRLQEQNQDSRVAVNRRTYTVQLMCCAGRAVPKYISEDMPHFGPYTVLSARNYISRVQRRPKRFPHTRTWCQINHLPLRGIRDVPGG